MLPIVPGSDSAALLQQGKVIRILVGTERSDGKKRMCLRAYESEDSSSSAVG